LRSLGVDGAKASITAGGVTFELVLI